MARLYVGFQTMGGRDDVLKKLRLAVTQAKAVEVVPVIRIERRTRRRGRGEYYVFVAYETASARDAKAKADAVLDLAAAKMNLTIQGAKRFHDLTLGGIGSIVEGEELQTEAVGGGGAWLHEPGDPYEYFGSRPPDAADASTGHRYERLLQWMSAYGGGTWETLARACVALDLAAERSHVWGIVRRLVLLGHTEFDYDAKRWSCCPPVISCAAHDASLCILAGRAPS